MGCESQHLNTCLVPSVKELSSYIRVQVTFGDEIWAGVVGLQFLKLHVLLFLCVTVGSWRRSRGVGEGGKFTSLTCHQKQDLTPAALSGHRYHLQMSLGIYSILNFVPKYAPASLISGKAPFMLFVV